MTLLATATEVTKTFKTGALEVHALRGVDLAVHARDFMALVGPSGSGKTTLLNLLGALDRPTSGEVEVLGKKLGALSKAARAKLRLASLGFVFQAYNLVPVLTAAENVELILELQGMGARERRARALDVLLSLGLGELANRRPNEMSGGQQQRVAVARAVASRPELVLADEPTANLDGKSAEQLMLLMRRLHEEHGTTFVFSTHDPRIVAHATRIVSMEDGRIVSDETKDRASAA
ncbi:ABC transporter ATP-binding protein [Sandaracinus amylolyticus]|uniref:Methionine ABC transporter ATP-binding protein n=1 Tax=Sandaracinus amylolyticus TaxID=927083 RepID=A0A0F6W9K4_9BACT|nr:ABC transporter ATP-binding protein [Sandaracinus amylolyticus]AKF10937.1 Methionine ABC transporter ATP-binding protein [Sandaracinus amylolyticus]